MQTFLFRRFVSKLDKQKRTFLGKFKIHRSWVHRPSPCQLAMRVWPADWVWLVQLIWSIRSNGRRQTNPWDPTNPRTPTPRATYAIIHKSIPYDSRNQSQQRHSSWSISARRTLCIFYFGSFPAHAFPPPPPPCSEFARHTFKRELIVYCRNWIKTGWK